jgi:hypothetical protein
VISLTDFEKVAHARFEDAVMLAMYDRYDGAIYLCGFAVEIALKIRITKEHQRTLFPEKSYEFKNFNIPGIKTHSLVKLRDLLPVPVQSLLRNKHFDNIKINWNVDHRYKKLSGGANEYLCFDLLASVEYLLKVIL